MRVVLDTLWAGAIGTLGWLSLGLDDWPSRWKREAGLRGSEESTGFRVVAGEWR